MSQAQLATLVDTARKAVVYRFRKRTASLFWQRLAATPDGVSGFAQLARPLKAWRGVHARVAGRVTHDAQRCGRDRRAVEVRSAGRLPRITKGSSRRRERACYLAQSASSASNVSPLQSNPLRSTTSARSWRDALRAWRQRNRQVEFDVSLQYEQFRKHQKNLYPSANVDEFARLDMTPSGKVQTAPRSNAAFSVSR